MSEENKENIQAEDWSSLSFLPPKREDEEAKKEFPTMSKGERIFRISTLALTISCFITLIVLAFIYAFVGNPSFDYEKGYGILGFIIFILTVLASSFVAVMHFIYDLKFVNTEKAPVFKTISRVSVYLFLGLLYTTFALIPLRSDVLNIVEIFSYSGLILMIGVWAIVIALTVIEFVSKKDKFKKSLYLAAIAILPLIILCFSSILIKNYSMASIPSVWLLSFSALTFIISSLFFLNDKKTTGARSAGNFFLLASMVMELSAVLYYSMIAASPLY